MADEDEPKETEDAGQRHPILVRDPQLPSQIENLGAVTAFEEELKATRISGRDQKNWSSLRCMQITASLARRTRRLYPSWCFETELPR